MNICLKKIEPVHATYVLAVFGSLFRIALLLGKGPNYLPLDGKYLSRYKQSCTLKGYFLEGIKASTAHILQGNVLLKYRPYFVQNFRTQ